MSHLPNFWFEWLYLKLKPGTKAIGKMAGETEEEKGETLKLSISTVQTKTSVAHPVGPHGKNSLLKEDILDWDRNTKFI